MIISEYNSLYQLNWRGHIIMKSSSISSNWSGAFYCISFSVSFTVHSMEWRWFYCTNHVELVLITDTMKGYKIAFREPARCESQLFLLLLTDYEKQLERKWNQSLNIGNYVNVLDAKRLLLWSLVVMTQRIWTFGEVYFNFKRVSRDVQRREYIAKW